MSLEYERDFVMQVEMVVRASSKTGALTQVRLVMLSASKPIRDFAVLSVEEATVPKPQPPVKGTT